MKIKVTMENQRRCLVYTFDSEQFSADLTMSEVIKIILGDLYLQQTTYTRLVKIELVDSNEQVHSLFTREAK